jgi:hypothetical protein
VATKLEQSTAALMAQLSPSAENVVVANVLVQIHATSLGSHMTVIAA